MAEHTGNWYPIGPVKWDAAGNPYRDTSDGLKAYIPPIAAAQEQHDPKLLAWAKAHGANVTYGPNDANGNPTTSDVRTGAPEGGFAGNYHWNSETGAYEKDNFFDSSLGGAILGGSAVAAPFALGALGVGAPAAPATSIPAAFGQTAVDTVTSAAAGGAAGGAAGASVPSLTSGMATNTPGIPAAFGSNAVDTIASPAATLPGAGTAGATPFTAPTSAPSGAVPGSVAAPGASAGLPDWLKTAQDLTQGLGAAAGGRAQGRNLDNLANIGFAQAQNDLYNSELEAPQKIAHNAVRGDILSNARDVSIAAPSTIPVPTISGGLRPSMFSDTTRALGKNITANAAATPMPTPTPPVLQPMETAGTTDDILNTAGYLGNLAKPAYDIWKMFNHA